MQRSNTRDGFTLVEMLIVLAIMAIIAAIAAPNFQQFMAGRRLNGAARQIMTNLMAARMQSVSLNQRVKVFFNNTNNHEYEIWNDANGNGTVEDNEGNDMEKDIHTDYNDVSLSSNGNPIFFPRGTANNYCTITVTNAAGTKSITISSAGRVKIN